MSIRNNPGQRRIGCIPALIAAAALCTASCGINKKEEPAAALRQVRAVPAVNMEVPNELSGFGSLSFLKKIDISSPQDAVISKIFVREGDVVAKGELVVSLENPQIRLAVGRAENTYTQSRAALNLAKARLMEGEFQAEAQILSLEKAEEELVQSKKAFAEQERKHKDQEALFEAGGITEEAIRSGRFSIESEKERLRLMEKELDIRRIGLRDQDLRTAGITVPTGKPARIRALIRLSTSTLRAEVTAAEAQVDAAQKELESARLAASDLDIRSPAAGTVGAKYMEEGERIKREDKVLTLMDTGSLYAIFPVRETDALRLQRGMEAQVRVDGTGKTYTGTVDLVAPSADSQSFTFSVRVLIPPEALNPGDHSGGASLKPGMFARISIHLGPPRRVIAVPESSLINKTNNEGTVFVISGNMVSERRLTTGGLLGEHREIISGLNRDEIIVNRPDTNLQDGEHVSVAE